MSEDMTLKKITGQDKTIDNFPGLSANALAKQERWQFKHFVFVNFSGLGRNGTA